MRVPILTACEALVTNESGTWTIEGAGPEHWWTEKVTPFPLGVFALVSFDTKADYDAGNVLTVWIKNDHEPAICFDWTINPEPRDDYVAGATINVPIFMNLEVHSEVFGRYVITATAGGIELNRYQFGRKLKDPE